MFANGSANKFNTGKESLGPHRVQFLTPQILPQSLSQILPGPFDEAVHRRGAQPHHFTDFLVRKIAEAFQYQGLALIFR